MKRAAKPFIIALGIFLLASPAWGVRLKDITAFKGIRSNPLMGYGLVVGLNGTGDGSNTEFTIRSITNMLERMGVHIDSTRILQIKTEKCRRSHGHDESLPLFKYWKQRSMSPSLRSVTQRASRAGPCS